MKFTSPNKSVLLVTVALFLGAITSHAQIQPTRIQTIESLPSRRSTGISTLPGGSPWCGDGVPTVFMPGHKDFLPDRVSCLVNGRWRPAPPRTALQVTPDDLNAQDAQFFPGDGTVMDRHDCGFIDANNDGRMDIYCLMGANVGMGRGYNELYLTRRNGSLRKVRRHALQRFVGMRTRYVP